SGPGPVPPPPPPPSRSQWMPLRRSESGVFRDLDRWDGSGGGGCGGRRRNSGRGGAVRTVMKAFGFLSFGHYADVPGSVTRTAGDMLRQTIELAEGADEIGVNGAYVRVHHWARQAASPIPLLTA